MKNVKLLAIMAALAAGSCSSGSNKSTPDAVSDVQAELVQDVTQDGSMDQQDPDLTLPDVEPELADLKGDQGDTQAPAPIFVRVQKGEPVSADELAEVTALYMELLVKTRYFAATNDRIHGWPADDPQQRYWYGSWWSGVSVTKAGGEVTYLHGDQGADNNGMRTGPIVAGVCYAQALWGGQEELLRKLIRGFNSWILAMERVSLPDQRVLMTRASYPESVDTTLHGVPLHIDYSLNRPGKDLQEEKPPSLYVHNPDNPYWGDIWIKSKRSKDDIGHMLQAMAMLPACSQSQDPGLAEDLAKLEELYVPWCKGVEDDGWRIVTVDPEWNLFWPQEDLAAYIALGNAECKSMLAIRLYGRGDEGDLECGDGLSMVDEEWGIKNDFHQIQRSYHEAAVAIALMKKRPDLAAELMVGLAWRLDKVFDAMEKSPETYNGPHDQDLAELVANSAAVGLPLTWREIRYLHDRIKEAHAAYLAPERAAGYDLFNPATPDGTYGFDLDGPGFFWRLLAAPLGSCASPYVHPEAHPLLDCATVKQNKPY